MFFSLLYDFLCWVDLLLLLLLFIRASFRFVKAALTGQLMETQTWKSDRICPRQQSERSSRKRASRAQTSLASRVASDTLGFCPPEPDLAVNSRGQCQPHCHRPTAQLTAWRGPRQRGQGCVLPPSLPPSPHSQ
uniref:Uncharacterized protein n=1 Tax=Pipistrellus kuhlii TaxID=59472 RepID=A0A7J7TW11_PIPKU|nr:hypothetical protein mPipKuh1_009244 [Pipistrellus kuhlii]